MTNTEGGEGGVLKKVSRRMEKLTNDGHCNRSVIIIMIISSQADENRARGAIDLTRAARRRTTKREDHLWPPIVGQQRLILGFMIYLHNILGFNLGAIESNQYRHTGQFNIAKR